MWGAHIALRTIDAENYAHNNNTAPYSVFRNPRGPVSAFIHSSMIGYRAESRSHLTDALTSDSEFD